MRFYDYQPSEVAEAADPTTGMLPLDIDPKLAWALKFRDRFPVDVNRSPREMLLRVPGLGTKAVASILGARRWRRLHLDDVARLTVSIAKIRPFIIADGWRPTLIDGRADLRSIVGGADMRPIVGGADMRPIVAPKREQMELFG
jgi:predicted DNA-binding helix-hairpin-helix protein